MPVRRRRVLVALALSLFAGVVYVVQSITNTRPPRNRDGYGTGGYGEGEYGK